MPVAASLAPVHGMPVTDASSASPAMTATGMMNRFACADADVRIGAVVAMVMVSPGCGCCDLITLGEAPRASTTGPHRSHRLVTESGRLRVTTAA